ncbi:ABC transporter permease [Solitalea lacus]|uniref:ABC transporter permease n=1 Tax=Solitalea lacus TaxID=2911172 RepID=UPI001EDA6081|nr:FtsX-like permease family protein [Solitalea lacus]UKJ06708.1 ABC transporter permease [Solitalea lacus]
MLLKIAWRNIWRNKVRSLIVIIALALGLWAGIFASAFVNGMMKQKINSVIGLEISHLQFHQKDFLNDFQVKQYLKNGFSIRKELLKDPLVKAVATRTVSLMMISSAKGSGGVKVVGISPEEEKLVTGLHGKMIEGDYFKGAQRNPILISKVIAEKYKVGLRSKVVLTFQDVDGEITASAFRVVGIYDTGNKMYDDQNVFVKIDDIQKLLRIGSGVHELAVLLKEDEPAESMALKYQKKYRNLEVLSWMDLSSGMRYMIETIKMYTVYVVGILLLALLFSIVNTMLMTVLERVREIGMLMAIGMTKSQVFGMIMLETMFLVIVGGPLGLLLAKVSITYFGKAGINLGNAAYGNLGYSNIVFPTLSAVEYLKVTVMVLIMALIAAIYPASKALNLKPVEAIRKI